MPLPVIDANGEDPDLLLKAAPDGAETAGALSPGDRRTRLWLGVVLGMLIAVPVLLTLAGALTSPPHVRSVPTGRLIYLEADEPSDHTALLRGMRVMGPDGTSHQLLHETEPQDQDSGSREWISQPKASPDGHWLAFEKQNITLQEEEQGIDNQLWVMPLTGPDPQPRMLMDLTKEHLKQFIGLTWTPDSRSVSFLNDSTAYFVSVDGSRPGSHPSVSTAADMMASSAPSSGDPFAISLDGKYTASLLSPKSHVIQVKQGATGVSQEAKAQWGWSVFGGRRITALKWSPDGKYLAYSVSKPPLEDELFYIDLATGQCVQLPVRTGTGGVGLGALATDVGIIQGMMAQALHDVDEETDVGVYRAYLRAQTDSDLFDILQHLDPERYPARLDAAHREFRGRRMLHAPVYTANEYSIRYAALAALGLTIITLALVLLLTPADASGSAWPEGIREGMTALAIARMFATAILRGAVVWSVHLGLYNILWMTLGYWTVSRGLALRRHRARADVCRMTATAWALLTAAMLISAAPGSAIPLLFPSNDALRALSLFNPFG